jgi:hypothetical protein
MGLPGRFWIGLILLAAIFHGMIWDGVLKVKRKVRGEEFSRVRDVFLGTGRWVDYG